MCLNFRELQVNHGLVLSLVPHEVLSATILAPTAETLCVSELLAAMPWPLIRRLQLITLYITPDRTINLLYSSPM